MTRAFCFGAALAVCATLRAGPLDDDILSKQKREPKPELLHAFLSKDKESEPITKFGDDTAKVRAIWKGDALKAGDQLHAIWIAEDVGALAPKDSKITEGAVTAYKPDDDGVFALARPEDGWPLGKYRLEIYLNDKLSLTLPFTIEKGVTIEIGK